MKDPSIERFSVLDISPDAAYLLIGPSDAGGARSMGATLWSTSTGTKLQTIKFKDDVNYQDKNSRFSPDGKYILTTDYSGSYLWDTQGIQYRSFSLADANNPEGTLAAKFSPDGKYLFTINESSVVPTLWNGRIWDVATGKQLHLFEGVIDAFYSPDSKDIVLHTFDGYSLWDAQSYTQVNDLSTSLGGSIEFVDFSPNSQYLWGEEGQGSSVIVDVKTGKLIQRLQNEGPQPDARFFSDSKKIVFFENGDDDHNSVFSVRDIVSGKELWNFTIADGYVHSLGFTLTRNDAYIITGQRTEKLRVWDVRTGKLVHEFC